MPYLHILVLSLLHALRTWSGKGNFLFCVDNTDLCIYDFMLFRNRRQCQIVSKPTASSVNSKTAINCKGFTVKTVLPHPHAAELQQFKQQAGNVTAIFSPLQSMHQIFFCLVIHGVRLFSTKYTILLNYSHNAAFFTALCFVSSLIPGPNGSKM